MHNLLFQANAEVMHREDAGLGAVKLVKDDVDGLVVRLKTGLPYGRSKFSAIDEAVAVSVPGAE